MYLPSFSVKQFDLPAKFFKMNTRLSLLLTEEDGEPPGVSDQLREDDGGDLLHRFRRRLRGDPVQRNLVVEEVSCQEESRVSVLSGTGGPTATQTFSFHFKLLQQTTTTADSCCPLPLAHLPIGLSQFFP